MDTFSEFAHVAEKYATTEPEEQRVKVSMSLRHDDVYAVDRLAKALDMTRQDVISKILHTGLPDAFRGYFKVFGPDPLEDMTLDEYIASLQGGEMGDKE